MGKSRNTNKNKDRDPYAGPPSARGHRDDDDSDSGESFSTHLTFDDDLRSVQGDEVEDVDNIMDVIAEHIDNASHKNISIRIAALKHLQLALTSQYVPEFLQKYKMTLVDVVCKNLKKTPEEALAAAVILALITIQIGEDMSDCIEEALSLMRPMIMNPALPEGLRSMCCLSLAISTHLSSEAADEHVSESLKAVKHAWTSHKLTSHSTRLFSTALPSWALLLQSADMGSQDQAYSQYSKVTSYLEADQLDIRCSTGEVIAYMYELARESKPNFKFPNHAQFVEALTNLSNDSSKGKTKRDKRVQRFTFRQILSSIVDEEPPSVNIKFNRENLELDSCQGKLFYDLCCEILRGGMMRQLESNLLLRDIFDLGPIPTGPVEKVNKQARMAFHNDMDRMRKQNRSKQRDKRSAMF